MITAKELHELQETVAARSAEYMMAIDKVMELIGVQVDPASVPTPAVGASPRRHAAKAARKAPPKRATATHGTKPKDGAPARLADMIRSVIAVLHEPFTLQQVLVNLPAGTMKGRGKSSASSTLNRLLNLGLIYKDGKDGGLTLWRRSPHFQSTAPKSSVADWYAALRAEITTPASIEQ